ncbi:hypothetical protein JCM3765_005578 [Sporobolomyces pararoseus]
MSAFNSTSPRQGAASQDDPLLKKAMDQFEKGLWRWPHKGVMLEDKYRIEAAEEDFERLLKSRDRISKKLDSRNLRQFKSAILQLLDDTPENPYFHYTYECRISQQLDYVESSSRSPVTRIHITRRVCQEEESVPEQFKREWIDPIYRTLTEVQSASIVWMAFYYQVQAVLHQALRKVESLLTGVRNGKVLPRGVVTSFLEAYPAKLVLVQIGLTKLLPAYGDWRDDFPKVKLNRAFSMEKNLLHERTMSSRHLALYGFGSRGTAPEGGQYF